MTVSSTTSSETFACNGVTTLFVAPFSVLEATSVQGFLITIATGESAPLVNGTDFVVTEVGEPNVRVTTTVAYSSLYRLHIKRITPRLQETDYRDNDPFPAEAHEACLDRLTHIVQEDAETLSRAMVWPDGETAPVMPSPEDRANKYWANDADGNLVFVVPLDGTVGSFALTLASSASMAVIETASARIHITLRRLFASNKPPAAPMNDAIIPTAMTTASVVVRPDCAFMNGAATMHASATVAVATVAKTGFERSAAKFIRRLLRARLPAIFSLPPRTPSGVSGGRSGRSR